MSRLTKQIRLVLVSSSLALMGCQRQPEGGPTCVPTPSKDPKQPPTACGPVDGSQSGTGYHGSGYHFWGPHTSTFSGSSGSGHSWFGGGRSGAIGGRGGFGGSAHGVSS